MNMNDINLLAEFFAGLQPFGMPLLILGIGWAFVRVSRALERLEQRIDQTNQRVDHRLDRVEGLIVQTNKRVDLILHCLMDMNPRLEQRMGHFNDSNAEAHQSPTQLVHAEGQLIGER